tara:strand:- start:700 stop:1662 length:963 start_codon:yes stop_codon:yes gene_type:complete
MELNKSRKKQQYTLKKKSGYKKKGGTVEIDRVVKKMVGALEISQSFLKNLYNVISHKSIREAIINLILVKEGGRTAYLYMRSFRETKEKSDFVINLSENMFLKSFAQDQGIVFVNDPKHIPEPMKELENTELGELLGYSCYNHDYSNVDEERVGVTIYLGEIGIYGEYCEKNKISRDRLEIEVKNKIEKWSKILNKYGILSEKNNLDYKLTDTAPGRILLDESNWKDINFVRQHLEQYENHLADVFVEDNELDILGHFDVFIFIMEKVNNDVFESLLRNEYSFPQEDADKYYEFVKRIQDYSKRLEYAFDNSIDLSSVIL